MDKFDYLARDSMYCGLKLSCDFNRVMQFSKVGRLRGWPQLESGAGLPETQPSGAA